MLTKLQAAWAKISTEDRIATRIYKKANTCPAPPYGAKREALLRDETEHSIQINHYHVYGAKRFHKYETIMKIRVDDDNSINRSLAELRWLALRWCWSHSRPSSIILYLSGSVSLILLTASRKVELPWVKRVKEWYALYVLAQFRSYNHNHHHH